jgi:hypothetical protein
MKTRGYFGVGMLIFAGLTVSIVRAQDKISHTFRRLQLSNDTETIVIQYRTAHDAIAPSQFVALYTNGMTMGLKIDWKIEPAIKQDLDRVIATYENERWSGATFIVKAIWLREGIELQIYDIKYDF